jgi:lysophospholipase L1-like esterase
MNDCNSEQKNGPEKFTRGLTSLIEQVRSRSKELAIILHTPPRILPSDPQRHRNLPQYAEAVRHAAKSTGSLLVDHYAAWLAFDESERLNQYLADAIHPNEIGHRIMARTLLESLGLLDSNGPFAKLAFHQATAD